MGINLAKLQQQNQDTIHRKLFPPTSRDLFFSERDLEISNLPASTIRSLLISRSPEISLPILFNMFHYKKQQHSNKDFSLVDVFYDQPLSRAKCLQKIIEIGDNDLIDKLPLLGFVISIKDSIIYKGSDCTLGFQEYVGKPFNYTARIIDFIESKGALISCKGNVPQALMMMESYSTAFGSARNPLDSGRTCGGSSGGEAALIATGQVNAAIGSDIAGSLRIPALFCGIHALKPTAGRFGEAEPELFENSSDFGRTPESQALIKPTLGPMARNVQDLELLARIMSEFNELDCNLPPLKWTRRPPPSKVGLIRPFDNLLEICETAQRAIDVSVELLESKGVEVVEIDLNDLAEEIVINLFAVFFKDEEILRLMESDCVIQEPLHECFTDIEALKSVPSFLLRKLIEEDEGQNREVFFYKAELLCREKSYKELARTQAELVDEVIQKFRKQGVECAIFAGLFPALKINTSNDCYFSAIYTAFWNYLNFPVGAVPVTFVQEDEQFYQTSYSDLTALTLKDNMKKTRGLPVGLQVVGMPWKEELVIELMKLVDSKIKLG